MDAFAVSIAIGIGQERVTPRHIFRVAFHFGLFQALMPLIGWFVGQSFATYVKNVDHWVAFGLLAFIGGRMLWESRKRTGGSKPISIRLVAGCSSCSPSQPASTLWRSGCRWRSLGINEMGSGHRHRAGRRRVKLPGHHLWRPDSVTAGNIGANIIWRLRLDRHRRGESS